VTEILPRRNSFVRPAVANVDVFVATVSVRDPEPHAWVLDRFLVTAESAGADAVVCVNKIDLGPAPEIGEIYEGLYDTVTVSARTGAGIAGLKERLTGRRAAFAGPSGVGKSSIVNGLLGREAAETGDVSGKTGRGRHTTRHVELFGTDFGAELFDTPGYTSFEGAAVEPALLGSMFPEIAAASEGCRFDDCLHADEPDCAVRAAVEKKRIDASRYASYLRLLGEALERKEREYN
jgi:ribosome biogenesis GTPase